MIGAMDRMSTAMKASAATSLPSTICLELSSEVISRSSVCRSRSPTMLPAVNTGVMSATSTSATLVITRNRSLPISGPALASLPDTPIVATYSSNTTKLITARKPVMTT